MPKPHLPNESGKRKSFLLPIAFLCGLVCVGFGTYLYFDNLDDGPPTLQPRPKPPGAPPVAQNSPVLQKKNDSQKLDATPQQAQPAALGSSATVGELTTLLSAVDLKKVEVTLLELDKKVKELEAAGTAASAPAPVIVAAPPVPGTTLAPEGLPAPPAALPRVVAIEGIDGHLQATLTTKGGHQRVKAGDVIDQGRIETINAASVVLRTDGSSKILLFED